MFIKAVYLVTFTVWAVAMAVIATTKVDFSTQVPMCMLSTMIIFGISTLIVKRYEKKES